ncbi:transmembrane protein, putative [Rhizoctonia solani AG-3 Rhs1AP]|uniref:Transmembrane protein, putative n=1 Tax=Rhizoctonia solani AG-3 Rhs1AP TaxID=1086054 RepID=X8JJM6_9AGAM|nr:transmembrane protein, putative [Rhizoctonia solani AG-3 Rhs1AP]
MTWPTFHTQHPVKQLVVKDGDMKLATLAFGWTIGFGYFVVWHAIRQTKRLNAFTVMIWGEILVCAIFAIICWLYLCGVIGYSFWFYFIILTTWALQVQFLLQIIVNRICILLSTPRERFWLKFIIAAWITAINISVYCIWVPAKLQISDQFHDINIWWDRTEKCLYLVTDAILNFMFIRSIKQRLLKLGLKKYDKLVKFNEKIIAVSLAMDVLIITMMSYPNSFVYVQFHPVAYIVKLEIEMCMSKLMVKVATGTGITIYEGDALEVSRSKSSKEREQNTNQLRTGNSVNIRVATHTVTHTDHHETIEETKTSSLVLNSMIPRHAGFLRSGPLSTIDSLPLRGGTGIVPSLLNLRCTLPTRRLEITIQTIVVRVPSAPGLGLKSPPIHPIPLPSCPNQQLRLKI